MAYYLGDVGGGLVNPDSARIVHTYHDRPIMRSMMYDGMTPGTLPSSGIELLNKHLATVPRSFAAPIEQRLEHMGVI